MFQDKKHKFMIDGFLKSNLDIAKKEIRKDFDMVFIVDGAEGSGKSIFAMQMAYYLDRTFSLDNIAFTPDQFKKKIINAKKYQAIVFDEAFSGLYSRNAMSYVNISLVSMLAEIRQKNLFIFIVLPTFFDLDRYVAIWRARALFHVYLKDGFTRGQFLFFNSNRKKNLYMKGYKVYGYGFEKANFYGKFGGYCVVDDAEYRKLKLKNLRTYAKNSNEVNWIKQRNILVKLCLDKKIANQYEIAKIIGCSNRQIGRITKEMFEIGATRTP